jgi:hypothetical protein
MRRSLPPPKPFRTSDSAPFGANEAHEWRGFQPFGAYGA